MVHEWRNDILVKWWSDSQLNGVKFKVVSLFAEEKKRVFFVIPAGPGSALSRRQ